MQSFSGHGPCPAPSVRMIPFDFHRCCTGALACPRLPAQCVCLPTARLTARAAAARVAMSSYASCDKSMGTRRCLGCERGKLAARTLGLRPPIWCTGVLHPDALACGLRLAATRTGQLIASSPTTLVWLGLTPPASIRVLWCLVGAVWVGDSVCGKLAFRNLPLLVNECKVLLLAIAIRQREHAHARLLSFCSS
jgi:hypothetical protein